MMKTFRFATNLLWLVLTKPIAVLVLIAALLGIYWYAPGVTQNPPPLLPAGVEAAATEIAKSIIERCGKPERSLSRILILPIPGDREGVLEKMIHEEFKREYAAGWYFPIEKAKITQAMDALKFTLYGNEGLKVFSKEDAVKIAQLAEADLVLFSQIDRFSPVEGSHEIRGAARLIDIKKDETLVLPFDNSVDISVKLLPRPGGGTQLTALLIFTLIWPILMIPILRLVVARESNQANFFGILLMGLVPLTVALLLVGREALDGLILIGCFIFFALTTGWVAFVMNKLAEK